VGGDYWLSVLRRGYGLLFGRGRSQVVVALDFQLPVLKHRLMAQVGIKADVLARRSVLVTHGLAGGVADQLVQAWNRN